MCYIIYNTEFHIEYEKVVEITINNNVVFVVYKVVVNNIVMYKLSNMLLIKNYLIIHDLSHHSRSISSFTIYLITHDLSHHSRSISSLTIYHITHDLSHHSRSISLLTIYHDSTFYAYDLESSSVIEGKRSMDECPSSCSPS